MASSIRYLLRKLKGKVIKRNIKYVLTFSIFVVFFNKFFHHGSDIFVMKTPFLGKDLESTQSYLQLAKDQPRKGKPWKNILLWTPYFGYKNVWKKMFRRHINKECKEHRCKLLTDRRKYMEADAILFNGNNLEPKYIFYNAFQPDFVYPKKREQSQIYVFFSLEAPPSMETIDLSMFENFFNWTMTYRTDSDVHTPYGHLIKKENIDPTSKYFPAKAEDLKNKKMAAWMVSHCHTESRREVFVQELQRFIPVDVYGKCGTLKCGMTMSLQMITPGVTDPCDNVTKSYIFYLSLENSLCKDYVTEKFYRALKLGVIPVVMGGVNYTSIAPPNSFIDVKDFDSVAALADHLKKVAGDINLYNEYIKWKDYYDIDVGYPYKPLICGLCEKLHSTDIERDSKTYEDINEWYSENASCHSWN